MNLLIFGVDPRVDVDSIRLECIGPANITDIEKTIVSRDAFGDFSSDEDEPPKDKEEDFDSDADSNELHGTKALIRETKVQLAKARNVPVTSAFLMQYLDHYGHRLEAKDVPVEKVAEFVELYRREHAEGVERKVRAEEVSKCERKIARLMKEKQRLEDAQRQDTIAILARVRGLDCEKEEQKASEKKQRAERRKFLTPNAYLIKVHLDGYPSSSSTSVSSRSEQTSAMQAAMLVLAT